MRFVFIDRDKIGVFEDGKKSLYESTYIQNYKDNAKRIQKNREWKKKSDIMIEDGYYGLGGETIHSRLYSACFTTEENKIAYTFSVNELSRVCFKYLDDEQKTEAHVVSSNEVDFLSYHVNEEGKAVGSIRTGEESADIAVFNNDGDYKLITSGDSLDENPFIDERGRVLFNSYGIGRSPDNEFITYVPSEIFEYNLQAMEIKTLLSDEKYSFVKPMKDGDGNLYCIRKPGAERKRENVFLSILLIPVRIIEAIIGFVSAFVSIFAGKPLMSNKAIGGGGAKKSDKDPKEVFIHNQMINVEQERKRNQKTEDGGFIPKEWKLLRYTKKEDDFEESYELQEEIASGVADYCLVKENGKTVLLYTNGQRIFSLENADGKWLKKKLVNTDFCVNISALYGCMKKTNEFDELFR